jgi:hypothetical protein
MVSEAEKIKKGWEKLPTMEEALQRFKGKPKFRSALDFLNSDFELFTQDKHFMRAYAGLSACQQLLGPMSGEYRKALEEMRKTLDSLLKARNTMVPDEWVALVKENWTKTCAHFQKHVAPEVWNAVGTVTEQLFDKLRT